MISARKHTSPYNISDEEALLFSQSFEQHKAMLYTVALRMLGYGEDAKDAVQETFIKAYVHLHTLKDKAAMSGWLKSIIYNHCLTELRFRKKRTIVFSQYAKEKEVVEDAIFNAENTSDEIKNTLADLSETLQLTTMLRFFSKRSSYQEISEILSIPIGTVRSRLAESRTKLHALFKQKYQPVKNNKAKEMEDFYRYHFHALYDDVVIRNKFLDRFDEHVYILLTSGKTKIGAEYMRKEIEFDLRHGARATLTEVNSSGNVSVIEISNINPPDNPNLCPAGATFIAVHPHKKIEKMLLHNAQNLPHQHCLMR